MSHSHAVKQGSQALLLEEAALFPSGQIILVSDKYSCWDTWLQWKPGQSALRLLDMTPPYCVELCYQDMESLSRNFFILASYLNRLSFFISQASKHLYLGVGQEDLNLLYSASRASTRTSNDSATVSTFLAQMRPVTLLLLIDAPTMTLVFSSSLYPVCDAKPMNQWDEQFFTCSLFFYCRQVMLFSNWIYTLGLQGYFKGIANVHGF